MSFAMRLCAFIVIVCALAWWNSPTDDDLTPLALRQFQNDDAVSAELRQAAAAQSYAPLVWPILALALGTLMFWDDVERCWKHGAETQI